MWKKTKLVFEKAKLNSAFVEIYTIDENSKVYSKYPEIKYNSKDGILSFAEALENKKITLEEIMLKMEVVNAYNDGGSVILSYHEKDNDLANIDFYLVQCNIYFDFLPEEERNQNIYISDYQEDLYSYCKK